MPGCSLSAAENFLQRIAYRPISYPIFGDSPRPVDWVGAQGPCNDSLTVELPIAPSASCDPVWRYRGGIAAVMLQVGGCVAAVCPFSLGGGLLEGLLGDENEVCVGQSFQSFP
jgi:hypothetical protein